MYADQWGEVTVLLRRWDDQRDQEALNAALPHLIDRLRYIARHYLAQEPPGHTLEPTALVHEAYLRLLESRIGKIGNRSHFFAFTARLMRQILVDHARGRRRVKRGGGMIKTSLEDALDVPDRRPFDADQVLAVHELLDRLETIDPRQRRIVELRYFLGLTVPEISAVLEISVPTVERGWTAARCWLARSTGPP